MKKNTSSAHTGASDPKRIALVGNPNTGKTSLFNTLTGLNQKVGNYPGVTVDRKTGFFTLQGESIELMDLPGTYSLAARSLDETVVIDILIGKQLQKEPVDLILIIVDASNLTRNLYLVSQILELNIPVVLALNMTDIAASKGLEIDADCRKGIDELKTMISDVLFSESVPGKSEIIYPEELNNGFTQLKQWCQANQKEIKEVELFRALVDQDGYTEKRLIQEAGDEFAQQLISARSHAQKVSFPSLEAQARYRWIAHVLKDAVRKPAFPVSTTSDTLDRYFTHKLFGSLIFLVIMAIVFQSIYAWAAPIMDTVESFFGYLGGLVSSIIPEGALQSLLVDGVIGGVGGILVFLPQIAILFFFIALLEDCGYLPRAAYLMDRILSFCGLSGKSCIPLLSSFACAIPGVMATRTIENKRDRLVTMIVAPLMSCSARLPVYLIFIGAFVPNRTLLGDTLNLQGITLLACYLIGISVAIPIAWIFKKTVASDDHSIFIMEFPSYKLPSLRNAILYVYEQCREFILRAGTIILCVSVLVWALAYFPHSNQIEQKYETERQQLADNTYPALLTTVQQHNPAFYQDASTMTALLEKMALDASLSSLLEETNGAEPAPSDSLRKLQTQYTNYLTALNDIAQQENGDYLRESYLGKMGRWIEPIVRPMGWDWRIGMAAIASFPAREIIVATLGTILNLGDQMDEESSDLRSALQNTQREDGTKLFTIPVAFSIIVFFALCCQCAATLAIIQRETKSWKWPLFVFCYMTALAYVCSILTYQVGMWAGLG